MTVRVWADGPGGSTPLNAAALNAMEADIAAAKITRNYDGSAWEARGSSLFPRIFVSSDHAGAPQPADMVVGDMWIRHPDDFEA